MAKPAKPAVAKKDDAAVADAPKGNKKLIIIVAVLVLLAAAGAGWFFMQSKNADHDTPKVVVHKDPIFIPLEAFTVNLQREEADQYLQINISLKVFDPDLVGKIKAVLPEIRSKLNLLLSSKRPSELAAVEGKKKLAVEIAREANNVLGIHPPAAHAPVPVAAPAAAHEAVATEKPAEGEAATPPATEAGAEGEAASAPVVAAPAPVHVVPAAQEQKGVVDVLFTSFIIQ